MLDKVLIVDDERIVRQGLRALVPWAEYGMKIVAEAPNGQKGWEAFLLHQPQIVITDIVMPELNGLDLAKRIKAHAPKTRILLLSCHQDFAYAKQGIQIGVSGYLLKTVWDEEELNGYLQRFRDELDADAQGGVGTQAVVVQPNRDAAFFGWLHEQNDQPPVELSDAIEHCCTAASAPVHTCLIVAPATAGNWRWLEQAARMAQVTFCGKERCFWVVTEQQKRSVEAELIGWRLERPELRWEWCGPLVGSAAVLASLQQLHRRAELLSRFDVHPTGWHDPIDKAVQWVLHNLSQPLTAVEVAERVGLSRSHFCTLFKKTVGESFGLFLERRRAKMASELLASTTLHVQDIAAKVGMPDAKYFSKWFKKATGYSPREFRRKQIEQKDDSVQTK